MALSITERSRRDLVRYTCGAAVTTVLGRNANAAEIEGAQCAVLARELRIRVPDIAVTSDFLEKALGMTAIAENTYAFGPTSLETPSTFLPGISTFDDDGRHLALHLEEGPVNQTGSLLSFVQLALPNLRASKLITYGGTITEAYGVVDIIAPGGFPFRLLLGDDVRDRAMFICLRVNDISASTAFYQRIGFQKAPYPRARPPTTEESPFDPNPPSKSVYLTPCDDSFGILLVPASSSPFTFFKKQKAQQKTSNNVLGDAFIGLDVLASSSEVNENDLLFDPDGLPLRFLPLN